MTRIDYLVFHKKRFGTDLFLKHLDPSCYPPTVIAIWLVVASLKIIFNQSECLTRKMGRFWKRARIEPGPAFPSSRRAAAGGTAGPPSWPTSSRTPTRGPCRPSASWPRPPGRTSIEDQRIATADGPVFCTSISSISVGVARLWSLGRWQLWVTSRKY